MYDVEGHSVVAEEEAMEVFCWYEKMVCVPSSARMESGQIA